MLPSINKDTTYLPTYSVDNSYPERDAINLALINSYATTSPIFVDRKFNQARFTSSRLFSAPYQLYCKSCECFLAESKIFLLSIQATWMSLSHWATCRRIPSVALRFCLRSVANTLFLEKLEFDLAISQIRKTNVDDHFFSCCVSAACFSARHRLLAEKTIRPSTLRCQKLSS